MDNGFNRACPSGSIMVELSGGEPPPYRYECEHCSAENSESHNCTYCGEEITDVQCENGQGKCAECAKEIEQSDV